MLTIFLVEQILHFPNSTLTLSLVLGVAAEELATDVTKDNN